MIRAAHLLPHDGVGGVETAARSMVTDVAHDEFRIYFIAGPSSIASAAIVPSRYKSVLNPLAWVATARNLKAFAPDVLIFSLWKSVPTALLTKLLRPRTKLAYTLNLATSPHLVDRLMTFLALCVADEAWSDSIATEQMRKPDWIAGRRLSFVRSGIMAASKAALGPNFVCWCRIHHQKGLDRAVDLIALLRKSGINATFDIFGPDDGEEVAIRDRCAHLELGEAVRLHGPVSQERLAAIATEHSFFLMPSRSEGMAMATVEAMQLGLVPVVTAVGEMGHYVVDDENGIILNPDNLSGTVDRITQVLNDPDRYAQMRQSAIGCWNGVPTYKTSVTEAICSLAARDRPL